MLIDPLFTVQSGAPSRGPQSDSQVGSVRIPTYLDAEGELLTVISQSQLHIFRYPHFYLLIVLASLTLVIYKYIRSLPSLIAQSAASIAASVTPPGWESLLVHPQGKVLLSSLISPPFTRPFRLLMRFFLIFIFDSDISGIKGPSKWMPSSLCTKRYDQGAIVSNIIASDLKVRTFTLSHVLSFHF